MALRARCPNSKSHTRFITTAHVMEEWIVDERGNWLETRRSLEITYRPNPGNIWICAECSASAEVTS